MQPGPPAWAGMNPRREEITTPPTPSAPTTIERHTDLMGEGRNNARGLIDALRCPEQLWTRSEVLERPSPVPPLSGVYGWHFAEPPTVQLEPNRLLYVGIAPRHILTRTSSQNLRTRIRYHYRGNASGSTLRLTLGCLLGLELRRVGSGTRMTFGPEGEDELSAWMGEHARVCWLPVTEPWVVEAEAIALADLPLNLDQNRRHSFHAHLTQLRSKARTRARQLPVLKSS